MRLRNFLLTLFVGVVFTAQAAVLPPEKLLPADTLFVITVPDATKARSVFTNSPQGRLWTDPAMKPFVDKFTAKFTGDVLGPIEKEFAIKFSDYQAMAQGQFTFALLPSDKTNSSYSKLIVLDTKDQGEKLKKNLADVKKKWMDSGKQARADKIRDVEFTTLITSDDELSKTWDRIFPKVKDKNEPPDEADAKKSAEKFELTIGQLDSLLIVSDSGKVIEKVLSKQAGGLIPSLGENPEFQANFASLFRDAPVYAWVNAKTLVDTVMHEAAANPSEPANLFAIRPEKVLTAIGLSDVKSIAFVYRDSPEGATTQFFVGVPEAKRRGIFKIFAADVADANPLPFVPADAVRFSRWRLNLSKGWSQLEAMLTEISPAVGGASKLLFENAGKDKDEKYDLKSELLNNLGNDVISYEKAPRTSTLADLKSNPSIYLVGSPNSEKLAAAIKVAVSTFNPTGLKEREFLGRKIYSLESGTGKGGKGFCFAPSGGYVALSSDAGIVEEFLRSNDTKPKPLGETAGLNLAAQKVGGTGTGLFGFNNQNEEMRALLETLRKESGSLADLSWSKGLLGIAAEPQGDQVKKLKEWADFSLLPPYETLSKYFYFSVNAGSFTPEGFSWKFFSPTPPQLKGN